MCEFKQVVVWPFTRIGEKTSSDFENFILEEFNTRAKFIGEFKTSPDFNDNASGGRTDLCFYVASEDIFKFAVQRLSYGMRWLEDVLDNEVYSNKVKGISENYSIYSEDLRKLRSW